MKTCKTFLATFLASFLLSSSLFSQIDTPPKPLGGNQWMREFICNEMIYPESAISNKEEGTVEILLTVMQDGKTTNYRIHESVSPVLDREAMRICKLIMFYPAVRSSNYIINDYNIPVKFNVKKYNRNCKKKGFDSYEKYDGAIDTSLMVYPIKALDESPKPAFEDSEMDFGKFITENIKYPETAYTQNISGDVELSFIVEASGRISNLEIINPLGGGCTEEAIHLLKQILWKPGILDDMAVRTSLSVKISFSLDNNSNHQYLPNNNNTTM